MFQRGFIRIVLHFQRVTEIREVVKNVSCPIPVRADALGQAGGQIIDLGLISGSWRNLPGNSKGSL